MRAIGLNTRTKHDNNLSSVLLTVVLNSAVHRWVMEGFRHTNGNLLMQRKVCVDFGRCLYNVEFTHETQRSKHNGSLTGKTLKPSGKVPDTSGE